MSIQPEIKYELFIQKDDRLYKEKLNLTLQKKKKLFWGKNYKDLKRKIVYIGYLYLSCSEFHQK